MSLPHKCRGKLDRVWSSLEDYLPGRKGSKEVVLLKTIAILLTQYFGKGKYPTICIKDVPTKSIINK